MAINLGSNVTYGKGFLHTKSWSITAKFGTPNWEDLEYAL